MAGNRRTHARPPAPTEVMPSAGRAARAVLLLAGLGAAGTALTFGGKLGYRWATTSPTFAIHAIELRGNRRASAEELVRLSGLVPGHNLFLSDTDAAESSIANEPWVKTVEVHRRLPDTVVIRVTEREPALLVDLGKLYFADQQGAVFKRALGGDDLDLPVVTGLSRQDFQDHRDEVEARLKSLVDFVADFRARGLDRSKRLEELNVDPDEGLTLELAPPGARASLQAVKLGEGPYEAKLDKLATLWGELQRRGLAAAVIHLENRTRPDWVAVKLAPLALADAPAAKPAPRSKN